MLLTLPLYMTFMLIPSTWMMLFSNNLFTTWLGSEINMLAMMPMILLTKNPKDTATTSKYLLIQAYASVALFLLITFSFWKMPVWAIDIVKPTTALIILIALMMKLWIAPMHFWMPNMLQGSTLMTGIILNMWQKAIPLIILYRMFTGLDIGIANTLAALFILTAGWGIVNQKESRKMLMFISIGHLGWMIIILPLLQFKIALLSLMMYTTMFTTMFIYFNYKLQTKTLNLPIRWLYTPPMICIAIGILLMITGVMPLKVFWLSLPTMSFSIKKLLIFMFVMLMFIVAPLLSTMMYLNAMHRTKTMMEFHTLVALACRDTVKPSNTSMSTSATISMLLMPILPTFFILFD